MNAINENNTDEKSNHEVDVHRDPFKLMKISDNSFLNDVDGRSPCIKCHKSRKFFCYSCYLPTESVSTRVPKVKLPLKIDIIKHRKEIDGKSTAAHAAILASDDVTVYTYPDIPDYLNNPDETTVLIFPTHESTHVNGIFDAHVRLQQFEQLNLPRGYNKGTLLKFRVGEIDERLSQQNNNETIQDKVKSELDIEEKRNEINYTLDNLPIKRAVFIDSTWNQCRSIFKDPRINQLRPVILQNRLSQFWRHQRGSPRWFLATIEAIHQFLLETHINAWGLNTNYKGLDHLDVELDFVRKHLHINGSEDDMDLISPYNGQYDNLFFFYTHMYQLIHKYYDHNLLAAYKRPIH